MSAPIVPPRPQRAQQQGGPTAVHQNMPQIPPRPARKTDPAEDREMYTRSPLNEPPTAMSNGKSYSHSNLSAELPRRPPSVSQLPSIGFEGIEYASFDQLPTEAHGVKAEKETPESVEQTRHADVLLQQPKASLPQSTAKSRISTVTRTDSSQAAAAGIGKSKPDDDVHRTPADSSTNLSRVTSRKDDTDLRRVISSDHPLKSETNFNRSNSSLPFGSSRPGSVHDIDHELGIPEIGLQVPMYPNAGDVQAPSPAPFQQFPAGIGFFNDGSQRNHSRRKSSRQEFGPPGSYGMHGHPGQEPTDQFERDWLMKHPEVAAKEGYNVYGGLTPRPETALSIEELNKLVNQNLDIGFGTSRDAIGTPSQEVGWKANELYTSRMSSAAASPAPATFTEHRKRPSSGTQAQAESPLRKTSFPFKDGHNDAVDSEDDVIHVEPDVREGSKVGGGGRADNRVVFGHDAGSTEDNGETDDGMPILASDEVMKRPGSAYLQPAISPEVERGDFDYDRTPDRSRRSSLQPLSRPSSRPNSMHGGYHGGPLHRFISHDDPHGSGMGTPLEEIEEYEPLFPEGEDAKPKTQLTKVKSRPGLAQHHFPSQDIWEDTPQSLYYSATVDTPEPPREQMPQPPSIMTTKASSTFETPEQEQARRAGNTADMNSDEKTFVKPHFKPGVQDDMHNRPGIQRFPSHDIWEDTPDSFHLVTTVGGPQMDEVRSPPDDRPTTTALPGSQDDSAARATTGMSQLMKPSIPERPQRKSKLAQEIKPEQQPQQDDPRAEQVPDLGAPKQVSPTKTKAPSIPDRPKPNVPARPARFSHSDQSEGAGAPLSKSVSAASVGSDGSTDTVTSPPAPKAKPVVPARPAGGKIAALQAGFMSDLNKRLQLGPQGPPPKVKEPEPEAEPAEEKAPLADARKGRAKGPARRKPATSPSAPVDAAPLTFSLLIPITIWSIDEDDEVKVPLAGPERAEPAVSEAEKALAANVKSNVLDVSPALSGSSVSVGPETPLEKAENPLESPELEKQTRAPYVPEQVGHPGDIPDSLVDPVIAKEDAAIQPGMKEALAQAEDAPTSAEKVQEQDIANASMGTGDQNAKTTSHVGTDSATEILGTAAPEEGSVVVRDGEEVGNALDS